MLVSSPVASVVMWDTKNLTSPTLSQISGSLPNIKQSYYKRINETQLNVEAKRTKPIWDTEEQ